MFKKILIALALCVSIANLNAGIPNGGACNPNGLTSTSNPADIATQDANCTSGFCNLSEKKCSAKYALEKTCNRTAQCKEGTCSNSKCLLSKDAHCTVATNCSSGVCTNNKCT